MRRRLWTIFVVAVAGMATVCGLGALTGAQSAKGEEGNGTAAQAAAEVPRVVGKETTHEIPEPGVAALLGAGAAALVLRSWRRGK